MSKISAVILTRNSENLIADCMESLNFCDQILLIDDNSTDRTIDLAQRLGAHVISAPQGLDFSDKRNLALKKVNTSWIFYIDSDERVSTSLKNSIMQVVKDSKSNQYTAYDILRQNYYLGRNPWPKIEKMTRFFKKSALKKWAGELHETAVIEGKIGELVGYLLHYTHSDLTSMLNKTLEWSEVEANLRYKAKHPKITWWRFPRVMLTAFWNSYVGQRGYKVGTVGLIESIYQAYSMFITYARLWEMQRSK